MLQFFPSSVFFNTTTHSLSCVLEMSGSVFSVCVLSSYMLSLFSAGLNVFNLQFALGFQFRLSCPRSCLVRCVLTLKPCPQMWQTCGRLSV